MIQSPKHVLMIAYEYPPMQAGGIVRTVNFAKYLRRFDWRPHVLTVRRSRGGCKEEGASGSDPGHTDVHRTRSFECEDVFSGVMSRIERVCPLSAGIHDGLEWRVRRLWNLLSVPDGKVYWALPGLVRALRIMARQNIHALYSTSWPYSDHLAGLILHKLTGKPWIADFRDPFLRHLNYGTDTQWKDRLNRRLESSICRNARYVLSPTDRATEQMQEDHPKLNAARFITIRNGFDEAEFSGTIVPSEDFEILHAGSLYLSRRPTRLLQAVELFLTRCPSARSVTRVTLMGAGLDHDLQTYADNPFVRVIPWQPRPRTIEAIRRARVLVLLRHPECSRTIPGKTYEYMASGNHILSITGTQPELTAILERYGNASVYPNPSVEALAQRLETLFKRFQEGRLDPVARTGFVQRFSRLRQTGQLADLLSRSVSREEHDPYRKTAPAGAAMATSDGHLNATV